MNRDVAPSAAPPASSPVADAETLTATVAMNTGIVRHARCTPRPAPDVAMRPRCPSSRAMTGPSIVVIASSHRAPPGDARIRTAIAAILVAEDAVGAMIVTLAGKLR